MKLMKIALPMALTAVLSLGAAQSASAFPILQFGQQTSNLIVHMVNDGGSPQATSALTISGLVTITDFFAGGTPITNVAFQLAANSTNPAQTAGPLAGQTFAGTFCFTSLAGCGGVNYLSGVFNDGVAGFSGQSAAGLHASTSAPGDFVSFTSDFAVAFNPILAIDLGFVGVKPVFGVTNGSLSSFDASVAGNFEADSVRRDIPVPEPASMLLLGTGLVGLGARLRRRK